eukprot:7204400-Prymnesium_polylepis.1
MASPPWRPPLPSTGVASALKWGRCSSHNHASVQTTYTPAPGFEPTDFAIWSQRDKPLHYPRL